MSVVRTPSSQLHCSSKHAHLSSRLTHRILRKTGPAAKVVVKATVKASTPLERRQEQASQWIDNWRKQSVLPGVLSASKWISAWREKQQNDEPSPTEEVPPHVADADRWIAAWRAKQVPAHVADADRWIEAWRAKQIPAHVADADRWIAAWRAKQQDDKKDLSEAVSELTEVLPHVAEAQLWIDQWRMKQGAREVLPHVAEAQIWIDRWRTNSLIREEFNKRAELAAKVEGAQEWIAAWKSREDLTVESKTWTRDEIMSQDISEAALSRQLEKSQQRNQEQGDAWGGCTDTFADNFSATALYDDGSCLYSFDSPQARKD
ncbi:hypothetical protein CYMTET_15553 [Cymbomonas tetramitiformis]|uniref:Uncharacterized protein n=2 Tax=Cymbomonas tetramitiformis TaxID=36881 RepID=A0AAE0GF94_9CHLO|nr:hypothetical protein CYMTET_15553 [Cymbomonas tetramitiformis]